MRIGELAESTGVDVETVRYYEKSGCCRHRRGGQWLSQLRQPHLERLAFIRHRRALDMPLADITRLLNFVDRPASDCGDITFLSTSNRSRQGALEEHASAGETTDSIASPMQRAAFDKGMWHPARVGFSGAW